MTLPHRPLGNTGLDVSPLGLGTVKFGRNTGVKYPESFALPSLAQSKNILAWVKDHGINLIDTAPAYGHSEELLGQLLTKQRQEWVIVTKAGEEFINEASAFDFSPGAIRASVLRSLRRLKTDYIDIVLIHSAGNDTTIIDEFAVFDTLDRLKKQGIIRAYGMSTKTVAGGLLTVEHADVVMLTFNPSYDVEREVITKAHALNKGVLIKKALGSGHINQFQGADPIQTTFSFIFDQPGVGSVIVGSLSLDHLGHNIRCVINCLRTSPHE
jgi:aryl-alcohol dehydrogenase-like predicted oxidoreductase